MMGDSHYLDVVPIDSIDDIERKLEHHKSATATPRQWISLRPFDDACDRVVNLALEARRRGRAAFAVPLLVLEQLPSCRRMKIKAHRACGQKARPGLATTAPTSLHRHQPGEHAVRLRPPMPLQHLDQALRPGFRATGQRVRPDHDRVMWRQLRRVPGAWRSC